MKGQGASRRRSQKPVDENGQRPDSEFDRFERFAKGLVNIPKKEIDEQAKKWDTRKGRPKRARNPE